MVADLTNLERVISSVSILKSFSKSRDQEIRDLAKSLQETEPSKEAMYCAAKALLAMNDECNRYNKLLLDFGSHLEAQLRGENGKESA